MKLSLNGTQTVCSFEQINLEHSLMYSLFCSPNLSATLEVEIKRIENDVKNLEGAVKVKAKLDELITLCRNSKNETDLIEGIMNEYQLSHEQAKYIANLDLSDLKSDDFESQIYNLDSCIFFLKEMSNGDFEP